MQNNYHRVLVRNGSPRDDTEGCLCRECHVSVGGVLVSSVADYKRATVGSAETIHQVRAPAHKPDG